MDSSSDGIVYRVSPPVSSVDLNALFAASWPDHAETNFEPVLRHSFAYVCAYDRDRLVGFVNIAWDGGIHAFLLDTTVHPGWRRRGIGRHLVLAAIDAARAREIHWLHVDFEPALEPFYHACGFRPTLAGLIRLDKV